jgi:putative ABC transport system permease protein
VNPIRWTVLRLRAIMARPALEHDMQEEMTEHLTRATERFIARGMAPADARRAAEREFGNVGVLQEQARDARGGRWAHDFVADVHFASRYFARHKATTAIIVTVLALGTGANALIFSMIRSQFFRPAPAMPSGGAPLRIWSQERATATAQWQPRLFTYAEVAAIARRPDILRDVAAWTEDEVILGADSTIASAARSIRIQFVTPNYFRGIGVSLSAGPGFPHAGDLREPSDTRDTRDVPDLTAVISYAMADTLYGNAVAAVGRRIVVNEVPLYIVGVAPARFQGALRNMHEPELWIPVSARADITHTSARWLTDDAVLSPIARLAPRVSRDQAAAFARQVVLGALPDSAARVGMTRTASVFGMQEVAPGKEHNDMVLATTMVIAIGVLILLVACTNISSLMVAAAVGRRHEIAVRLSLGASRARVMRQLITESTLLALSGSAMGLTLAWLALLYNQKTEVNGVDLAPDVMTFAYVLVLAVVTGVLFGLSPALHATRGGVASSLRESGTAVSSRGRLQRGFVVAQIALSQPLLVLLATILSLVIADYQPLAPEMSRRVIAVNFHPLGSGAPGQRAEAVDSLVPRISERPEVVTAVPDATGFVIRYAFAAERRTGGARPDSVPNVLTLEGTAPGWFAAVDVPIVFGRDVSFADTLATAAPYPVVIGSDLARKLWAEANPVGRTLVSPSIPGWRQDSIAMTVVGVYDATSSAPGMTWNGGVARGDRPVRVYTARGKQWRHDRVLVRTRGPAAPFVPELQRFFRARVPSLPVTSVMTLAQSDEHDYRDMLQQSALAGAGGVVALLVASLGLYGIVSLAVRQRTREIGIRIAVGARPMQVARMFLASGVRVSLGALGLGLPLSIVALKIGLNQGLVIAPDVNPYLIGLAIALLLVAVASAATWLPARRAARIDPAATLRVE